MDSGTAKRVPTTRQSDIQLSTLGEHVPHGFYGEQEQELPGKKQLCPHCPAYLPTMPHHIMRVTPKKVKEAQPLKRWSRWRLTWQSWMGWWRLCILNRKWLLSVSDIFTNQEEMMAQISNRNEKNLCTIFFFFVDMKYRKINHFKVNSSVEFSTFIILCNRCLYLVSKCFISWKETLYPFKAASHPSVPSPASHHAVCGFTYSVLVFKDFIKIELSYNTVLVSGVHHTGQHLYA